MPPRIHTVVGISGSGKTRHGINLVQKKLREGLRWDEIGYSSFSKAACGEAARRASEICGESAERLQRYGSFATLHSLAFRSIGCDRKSIIDPESNDGKTFISEACGAQPDARERGTLGQLVANSIAAWDLYRSRLGYYCRNNLGDILYNSTVINTSPDVATSSDVLAPHEPDGKFRVAAHENPVFHMESSRENAFLSHIETKKLSSKKRAGVDGGDFEKQVPCGANSEIPYVRLSESTPDGVSRPVPKRDFQDNGLHNVNGVLDLCLARRSVPDCADEVRTVIEAYERHKKTYGRLDFTDILLLFLGVTSNENLELVRTYNSGVLPNSVQSWIVDEYQDCSPLLACVAQRLSETSQELYLLGDPYQAVYGFAGSSGALLRSQDAISKQNGDSVLLNTSHRNPIECIEWGEEALREDSSYEEREPVSEAWEDGEEGVYREGSVGLVKWDEFLTYLPEMACSDVLVLARAWFSLLTVKDRLDSLGVPWRSCSEKHSSRWQCPAKIAYTLAMRDLEAGNQISEQDWRRITDTLAKKMDGAELFTRGTKAKWKKIHCSQVNSMKLSDVGDWGATPEFIEWVQAGKWRREMFLLLDNAISQFGIEIVRNPRIRLGSVHSVKGLEARNVFCLSASTERCSGEQADLQEEICLKYVAITRSSKNYRLVVNVNDIARSKPQFWAAPKGFWEFSSGPPDGHFSPVAAADETEGIEDSGQDSEVDEYEFRL